METTPTNLQTLDLPSSTLAERIAHANLLLELEAKKIAATLDVPTLAHQVIDALRQIGEPIRLFGENNANVRDRLRLCLARLKVKNKDKSVDVGDIEPTEEKGIKEADETQTDTTYTYADKILIDAREFIAAFSLEKSRQRLSTERKRRWGANRRALKRQSVPSLVDDEVSGSSYIEHEVLTELDQMDTSCLKQYKILKSTALEGSQYGDGRPLSAIATLRQNSGDQFHKATNNSVIVTGGWAGSIKLWDGSSPALNLLSTKNIAHEDRIMGVAIHNERFDGREGNSCLASASIDLTGKLWSVRSEDDKKYNIEEAAVLKGHQARLCKVAFHPSGRFVGTTSFDHTFRLWDIESGGTEILLQDGHWKEVYGIGFHTDGSLCSTSDFASVVQVWDLRTGKSACHFLVSIDKIHSR